MSESIHERSHSSRDRAWTVGVILACLVLVLAVMLLRGQDLSGAVRLAADFVRVGGAGRVVVCMAVFVAAGALLINSPVPISAVLKLGGGFLFGPAAGTAANVAMNVLGALVGFVAVRRAFRGRFARRMGSRLLAADARLCEGGFWYVLSARLALVVPFTGVNLACGLSGMRLRDFMWGSLAGSVPVALFYGVVGGALSEWSLDGVAPSGGMAWLMAGLAVAALVVPAGTRLGWGKKWLKRG